jgi:predicted PurR-regulated permease PerM
MPVWIIWALGISLAWLLLYVLRGVLTPLFIAFLMAYALNPVVDKLASWRIPRSLAIVAILVVVLSLIALFLILLVPRITRDVLAVLAQLPAYVDSALLRMTPALNRIGIVVPQTLNEFLQRFQSDAQGAMQPALEPAGQVLSWVVGGTASFIGSVVAVIVVPVVAFYLLYDFHAMIDTVRELIPRRYRDASVKLATEVNQVLGQFMRGQLIVMASLCVFYAVAYSLLGVRLAIAIALVGGLLSFIPYVGSATALGLALLMSFLDWGGWWRILGVIIAYTVIQLLEAFVITPRVVGEKVGLPAIWVLIALMVGSEVLGFLGVLIAVPVAAVIKIFILRGLGWYRRSPVFTREAPPL